MNLQFYRSSFLLISLTFFLFSSCSESQKEVDTLYSLPEQPELASGYSPKPGWEFERFAVAAAHPLAVDAGYQILRAGGSAVDAAIAVQLVLTLTEPQSSGIGGGAFLLVWDGLDVHAYNGREIAPMGADEDQFLDSNGVSIPFADAVRSGLSVGVPGTVALLKAAHEAHGRLPWSALFTPAITLSEEGFRVTPRLNSLLAADEALSRDPIASNYFYLEDGSPVAVGQLLKNPALAEILKGIAYEGVDHFYRGRVAEDIELRVMEHERPGALRTSDLEYYAGLDLITHPICNHWKEFTICGFPPPSSGHLTLMQILGIMEQIELPDGSLSDSMPDADWLHYYLEASKLAFADRNQFIADPQFIEAPGGDWNHMLDRDYLSERSQSISDVSMGRAEPGNPGLMPSLNGSQGWQPESGTSHISIVDANGMAISLTTTIESGFGSRIMSDGGTGLRGGFLLNNELTDFSLSPADEEGNPIANRLEPGKRPRSSMTPTLVFNRETGDFVATLGSPGGAAIIHYTAKTLIGMLEWSLDAQRAIDLPNFSNFNGPSILEEGYFGEEFIEALRRRGHEVVVRDATSGIHAIQVTDRGLFGGADPRREGTVMGE